MPAQDDDVTVAGDQNAPTMLGDKHLNKEMKSRLTVKVDISHLHSCLRCRPCPAQLTSLQRWTRRKSVLCLMRPTGSCVAAIERHQDV